MNLKCNMATKRIFFKKNENSIFNIFTPLQSKTLGGSSHFINFTQANSSFTLVKPLGSVVKTKQTELFRKGVHLGHISYRLSRSRSSHPSMSKFLIGSRNGVNILNKDFSSIFLARALYVIALVSQMKGGIYVVNTQSDFVKLVKNRVSFWPYASSTNSKWVGGTLTNWKQISKSITSFAKFSEKYDRFLTENRITYPKYNKMKICFQGFIAKKNADTQKLLKSEKKPALIFLANPNDNRSVIEEARKLEIPVVAITNSDTNLSGISYPIPANGCSLEVLHFCLDWIHRVNNLSNKNK